MPVLVSLEFSKQVHFDLCLTVCRVGIATFLLEKGASADLRSSVDDNRTAMFFAVFDNKKHLVELLLTHGEFKLLAGCEILVSAAK